MAIVSMIRAIVPTIFSFLDIIAVFPSHRYQAAAPGAAIAALHHNTKRALRFHRVGTGTAAMWEYVGEPSAAPENPPG